MSNTATMIFLGTTHTANENQPLNMLYKQVAPPKAIFEGPSTYTAFIVGPGAKKKRAGDVPLGGWFGDKDKSAALQMWKKKEKALEKLDALTNTKVLNIIGHSRGAFTARLVASAADKSKFKQINCLVFDPVNLSAYKNLGDSGVGEYHAYWQVVMETETYTRDLALPSMGEHHKSMEMPGGHEALVAWADAGHVGYMIAYSFLMEYETVMKPLAWQYSGRQAFDYVAEYLLKNKRSDMLSFFAPMFRQNWPQLAEIKKYMERSQPVGVQPLLYRQKGRYNTPKLADEVRAVKKFPKTRKWLAPAIKHAKERLPQIAY